MRRFLIALAVLAVVTPPSRAADEGYKTNNVIVAVMDGVRYSETFGDPNRSLIPNLAAMEKEGTLFTNYRIAGPGISVTRQGHSTISTGTWQTVALAGARMTMPSFFEYARNELRWKQTDCWCVFGKGPYSYADFSSFPGYGQDYRPWFVKGIGEGSLEDDDKVLETLFGAMEKDKPRLVFVNFGYTDHIAHVSTFDKEQESIKHCDELFGKLWKKVQSTPGYKDETTVFFTNDHGRHNDKTGQPENGFKGHGDQCDGCRHIMLLAIGPDVKKGATVDKEKQEIDLCPTVGELLGFQTTFSEGNVLSECLVKPLGLNTKSAKTPAAKAGMGLLALRKRDLIKTIADANLARDIKDLKPSVETEIVMRGMLRASSASGNDAYRAYVEKWVMANASSAATDPRVARVMLELGQAKPDPSPAYEVSKVRQCAERLVRDGAGDEAQGRPLSLAFLARAGQTLGEQRFKDAAVAGFGLDGKTEEDLVSAWRPLNVPNTPMACDLPQTAIKSPTMDTAVRFFALADAASAMPRNRMVRLAASLLGCSCSQGRPELGANWNDPAMSAVILGALIELNQVKPGIDWMSSEPALAQIKGMNPKAAAADTADGAAARKAKLKLPRWAQPMKIFWFDSVPWQLQALQYQVSAQGHFAGGDAMSDGAALHVFCGARGASLGERNITSFHY